MFHNISNPKWFGNWSRLEDDYLGNGGTDIADNFTFSKMEKTGGLFGSIIRLATAFPACDPETGHATGAWKVACESIDLDEVPLSDIADMISGFCHFRHRGDGKSRVSLPARLLEGRGDGGFLHRSKRRYRSRGLRPRDRGEPVAHGWRDCPRGRVLHRYQ